MTRDEIINVIDACTEAIDSLAEAGRGLERCSEQGWSIGVDECEKDIERIENRLREAVKILRRYQ